MAIWILMGAVAVIAALIRHRQASLGQVLVAILVGTFLCVFFTYTLISRRWLITPRWRHIACQWVHASPLSSS